MANDTEEESATEQAGRPSIASRLVMHHGWGALPSDMLHQIHLALAEQLSAGGPVAVRQAEAAAAALGAVNRHWRHCLREHSR